MPLKDFDETFQDELHDSEYVAEYLDAAIEEMQETGDPGIFLLAIRDILRARRVPVTEIAKRTGKSRPSLHKTLSGEVAPQFDSVVALLPEIGMRMRFEPIPEDELRQERELVAA